MTSNCNLKDEFNATLIKMLDIFAENPNEGGYLEFANYTMEAKAKIDDMIDNLIKSKYYQRQKRKASNWTHLSEADKARNPNYIMCVPCGKHVHKHYHKEHTYTERHRQSAFSRVALMRPQGDQYRVDDDVVSSYIVLQQEFVENYAGAIQYEEEKEGV